MDQPSRDQLKSIFQTKSTEELLDIAHANDRETYTEEAFSVISEILRQRDVEFFPPTTNFEESVEKSQPTDTGTKLCPYCAELIKKEAKICRYCNRDLPRPEASNSNASLKDGENKDSTWAGCLGIIIIIFLVMYLFLHCGGNEDKDSVATDDKASQTQTKEITAQSLYSDYSSNEVRADLMYKDRTLIVSGYAQQIAKDLFGAPYIIIGKSDQIFGVQCMFPRSDQSILANVSTGELIKVKGTVKGKLGNVLMEECKLQ